MQSEPDQLSVLMDFKPILLVLLVIRPAQTTTADYDYGGIPLRINRLRGEPSVLSLWDRIEPGWFRSVNPQVCPAECDCPIQWPSAIYCDHREMHQLPASLPPRTQYLFLQRNNISSIGASAFGNSTHLRWLLLDHNQVVNDQVAHSAFSNLSYLEILFMNHNNLTTIPSGLPHGLRQLRLAHNQIQKISPRAFQNLQNLTLLLLQGNQLKVISDEDFTGLLSLNLLDLSQNHLEEFPKHLPPAVQQLYLSNNSLRSLGDDSLHGFHSLRYLRLGHNRLQSSSLSAGAFNLSSLVELDISYNQLTSTPTVPTTLQYLYLEVNLIHEFNVSSFCRADGTTDYSRLRILRMEGNRMAYHQLPPDWVMCLRVIHRIYI